MLSTVDSSVTEPTSNVIIGEASESDSEEEINTHMIKDTGSKIHQPSSNLQGSVIAGEAPESDEEHEEDVNSVSSAASVSSVPYLISSNKTLLKSKNDEKAKYNSLLHKKLRERNLSLYRNMSDLVHNTITNGGRDLNLTNQHLLKSQVVLQEATTSLGRLQTRLLQLHAKLITVTSMPFLPNIRIPECEIPETVGKEESRLV